MNETKSRPGWKILWLFVPIIIGIAVIVMMKMDKQSPVLLPKVETSRTVRIIEVKQQKLIPQVIGYGTVQPAKVWMAVAQVSGRIIEMHPQLRDGEIIPKGKLLFRIDPVDYELTLAQTKAELAELLVSENNTSALLKIEQRNLALAEREHKRLLKLKRSNSVSQSKLDEAERATLNILAAVQNLKNTLALIPSKQQILQVKQQQAQRNLANTEVTAPFNLRVSKQAIETEQYVSKGQVLFAGDAIDRIEVIAQIPMANLRALFLGKHKDIKDFTKLDIKLSEYTGFKPQLRLDLGNHIAQWEAEFVRFSDHIDSETRTIGLVVAVNDPMNKIKPGLRPPLSRGMFVQVVLRGRPQPNRIILPRSVIRAGKVYLINADKRLKTQAIEILFNQGGFSVIKPNSGIKPNDLIVVSDLIPAVDGMLLTPQTDTALQQQLYNKTIGEKL